MATEIFNRHENKYLIQSEETCARLQARLADYMDVGDRRGAYHIANLYYDTADSLLIRTSLDKPAYKEKLRLRAYGVPTADATVYVEIKKKVMGMVNKRRSAMTLHEAYRFLASGIAPVRDGMRDRQVSAEIQWMLRQYSVKPALYLAYDRRAFGENDRDDVRITFDENITTRRDDLRLESGCYGTALLPNGATLMEVKAKHTMPLWLSALLDEFALFPVSFSKYGTEFTKLQTAPRRNAQCFDISAVLPRSLPERMVAHV